LYILIIYIYIVLQNIDKVACI